MDGERECDWWKVRDPNVLAMTLSASVDPDAQEDEEDDVISVIAVRTHRTIMLKLVTKKRNE